eukprot:TRINITY_DN9836_c0_g3_i1.p1 TRINITY_DN9836_c0_g3~~TRINITY_DN9836_c0_g3_i1.p1  ORF type:complete len:548 (+),score=105.76 TRINITY_DN9836_c0_g3_i1:278-1921(+)
MDRSYILDIVNVFSNARVDLTPGEKKVVSRLKTPAATKKPSTKRKSALEEEVDNEDCTPLKRSQARIQFKQGQVALERGCLDDSQSILLQALSKFDQLEDRGGSNPHNIDKIAILYHLGRISIAKGIAESSAIVDTIWNDPESLRDAIDEVREVLRAEEAQETEKRTKRKKFVIKDEYDLAVYHIEKARKYLEQAFEYCIHNTCPTMLRDVCKELSLITGGLDHNKTAAFLNLSVGNTALYMSLTSVRQQISELSRKIIKKGGQPSDIDNLTKGLQRLNLSAEESVEESESEGNEDDFEDDFEDESLGEMKERLEGLTERGAVLTDTQKKMIEHLEDFPTIISDLPPEWTVCTLNITPARDTLMITRLRANDPPVSVRIPIIVKRPVKSVRGPTRYTTSDKYEQIMTPLKEILRKNKEILKQSRDEPTKVEKNTWWDQRHELNNEMEEIVKSIEDDLFGGWKSLLFGTFSNPKLQKKLEERFQELAEKNRGNRRCDFERVHATPSLCLLLGVQSREAPSELFVLHFWMGLGAGQGTNKNSRLLLRGY